MTAQLHVGPIVRYDLQGEKAWAELLGILKPYARHFVYSAHLAYWHGQEEDVIEDILLETMSRILERSQKADRLEASPICSFKHLGITIARNYCIDKLRRDRQLQRIFSDCDYLENASSQNANLFEIAIEHLSQEELFRRLAHEVACFSEKRRRALLIDLASRMCFGTELTPLQKAFLAKGIDLREFQQALPLDPVGLARHRALVSLAYKQVALVMRKLTMEE